MRTCLQKKLQKPKVFQPKRATENSYGKRNALLASLGFASYEAYYSSQLRARIRDSVFAYYGKACRLCTREAIDVFFLGYGINTMLGKDIGPIIPVCLGCLQIIEYRRNGTKRSLVKAHGVYNSLREASKKLAKEEGRKIYGDCNNCGKKARKKNLYCRPCIDLIRRGLLDGKKEEV